MQAEKTSKTESKTIAIMKTLGGLPWISEKSRGLIKLYDIF